MTWAPCPHTTSAPAAASSVAISASPGSVTGRYSVPPWRETTTRSVEAAVSRTASNPVAGSHAAMPGSDPAARPAPVVSKARKPTSSPAMSTMTGRAASAALAPAPTVNKPAVAAASRVSVTPNAPASPLWLFDRDSKSKPASVSSWILAGSASSWFEFEDRCGRKVSGDSRLAADRSAPFRR